MKGIGNRESGIVDGQRNGASVGSDPTALPILHSPLPIPGAHARP
ncbi:lipid-A-disaccharide synthase, partial [Xanthomonas perforans]